MECTLDIIIASLIFLVCLLNYTYVYCMNSLTVKIHDKNLIIKNLNQIECLNYSVFNLNFELSSNFIIFYFFFCYFCELT